MTSNEGSASTLQTSSEATEGNANKIVGPGVVSLGNGQYRLMSSTRSVVTGRFQSRPQTKAA